MDKQIQWAYTQQISELRYECHSEYYDAHTETSYSCIWSIERYIDFNPFNLKITEIIFWAVFKELGIVNKNWEIYELYEEKNWKKYRFLNKVKKNKNCKKKQKKIKKTLEKKKRN